MRKLIRGIVDFRLNVRKGYREKWGRLANGQAPDSLFIACSDSRVVPNTFASTDPGDLFVVRNVGNLIPPCGERGLSSSDESEAAAIEFALLTLKVSDIIICGHSECGAMQALLAGREKLTSRNLQNWLRHGNLSLEKFKAGLILDSSLSHHNQLSQINVLAQLENVRTYPIVSERLDQGALRLHAWWFDIKKADVYSYEERKKRFVLIDEEEAENILSRLER